MTRLWRSSRILMILYVAAAALVTAAYAVFSARHSQSWIMGEWLINYAGGFVRRGLLGQAILSVAHVSHMSPLTLALVVQVLLYTGFYGCTLLLARSVDRDGWTWPLAALFLSPATLSFIVLDPPSSVRKEVLLLLALALLLLALRNDLRRPLLVAVLLPVAAVMCVLSHEGLVIYLPYLFVPVFLAPQPAMAHQDEAAGDSASGSIVRATWICLPAVLAAGLSTVAVVRHPGGPATAAAICHSLGAAMEGEGRGLCGGAIAYLAHDRAYARADLLRAARAYRYRTLYGVTGLLALAPVAMLFARLVHQSRRSFVIVLTATMLAALGSVMLFAYARDWGRWISIHVTCLLLLFLHLTAREKRVTRPDPTQPTRGIASRSARSRRVATVLGLTLYSTCWNLPATGNYHARWGVFGLIEYLHGYRTAPHHASAPAVPGGP